MSMIEDPRPKEFLAALAEIPKSVRAVKRLYAASKIEGVTRRWMRYVAPRTLSYRAFDESGKEWMRFETDGRLSTEWRQEWKRPERTKGFHVPDLSFFARLLESPDFWQEFGLGSEGDFPRTYDVEKRMENGFAVVALSYRGSDSIGRDQSGYLYLDAKHGLPRAFENYQGVNSPRDDGGFTLSERWTVLEVTR